MNTDLRDPVRVVESDVLPRFPRVTAAVHAIAREDVPADARLTHPDEHEIGIRLADRDRAH